MPGKITINASQGPRSASPKISSPLTIGANRNHVEGDSRWQTRKSNLLTTMQNLKAPWGSSEYGRDTFLYRIGHGPTDGRTDYNYMRGYHFKDWWGKHGYQQIDPRTGLTTYDYDDIMYPLNEAVAMGATPQMVVNVGTGDGPAEAGDLANYCNKQSSTLRTQYNNVRASQPYNVPRWEMGNEIAWQNVRGHSTRALDPTMYAEYARNYAKAIRDNSDIPVQIGFVTGTGSDFRGDDGWYRQTAQFESFGIIKELIEGSRLNGDPAQQQLDALIVHNYASWPQISDPKNGPELDKLAAFEWQTHKLVGTGASNSGVYNAIQQYSNHEIEIWNTEYFDHYYSSKSQSMFAAIYGIAGFAHAINHEFPINNSFCFFHGGNNFDEVLFYQGQYNQKTAWFRAFELLAQNWGDYSVRVTQDAAMPTYTSFATSGYTIMGRTSITAPKVRSCASYSGDGTKLYVLLINCTASEQIDVELALQNFAYNGNNQVTRNQISGSAGWTSAWNQIQLNNTTWTPSVGDAGANVIRLPASSITLLTFNGEVQGAPTSSEVTKNLAVQYAITVPANVIQPAASVDLSNPTSKVIENANFKLDFAQSSDLVGIFNKTMNAFQVDWQPRDRQAAGFVVGNTNTSGALVDGNATFMGTQTVTELTQNNNKVFKQIQFANGNWNGGQYDYKLVVSMWDRDPVAVQHANWVSIGGTARQAFLKAQIRSLTDYQANAGYVTIYSPAQRALSAAGSGHDFIDNANSGRGGLSLMPGEWRTELHNRNFEPTESLNTVAEYANVAQPHSSNVTKVRGSMMIFSTFDTTLAAVRAEALIRWRNWNDPPTTQNTRLTISRGTAAADTNMLVEDESDRTGGFDRINNCFNLNVDVNNGIQVTIKPYNSTTPFRQPKFILNNYSADFEPTIRRGSTKLTKGVDYLLHLDSVNNKVYVHMFLDTISSTSGTSYTIEALQEVGRSVGIRYNVMTTVTRSRPVSYKIKQTITKALAVQYKVKTSVTKTVAVRYAIKLQINKTFAVRYQVWKEVSKTFSVVYKIQSGVVKSLGVSYKVLQSVGLPLTFRSRMDQLATRTRAVSYKILTTVTKQLPVVYNIKQSNRKTLLISYAVTTEVTKSLAVNYVITGPITKTLPVGYNLLEEITLPLPVSYAVLTTLFQTLTTITSWPATGTTGVQTQSIAVEYEILDTITANLPITYKVKETITQTVAVEYEITVVLATKALPIIYNLRSPGEVEPISTLPVFYNVLEEPEVAGVVSANIGIRYKILEEVPTREAAISYKIGLETTKSLAVSYSIQTGPTTKLPIKYALLDDVTQTLNITYSVKERLQVDFPIEYKVLRVVTTRLTIKYGVLKPVTNYLPVKYGTRKEVTSVQPISYQLLYTVTRARAVSYGVIGRVGDEITSVSNVFGQVGVRLPIAYAVTRTVTQTVAISYKVMARVDKGLLVYYGIIGPVGRSFVTVMTGTGRIIKDLVIARNFGGPVTKSLTLSYAIVHTVGKSAGVSYKVIGRVTTSATITYALITTAKKSLAVTVRYKKTVTASLAINYQLLKTVTSTNAVAYGVIWLREITKPLALVYKLLATPSRTLTVRYKLKQAVTKSATVAYKLHQTVSKTLAVSYKLSEDVTASLALRWLTFTAVTSSVAVRYNLTASVTKAVTVEYKIWLSVTKSLPVEYNVKGGATKALPVRYGVKHRVDKSVAVAYTLTGTVTQTLAVEYAVVESVGLSLTTKSNMEGEVSKSLALTHRVVVEVPKILPVGYKISETVTQTFAVRYNIANTATASLGVKYRLLFSENIGLPPQPTDVWIDPAQDMDPPQPRGFWIDPAES